MFTHIDKCQRCPRLLSERSLTINGEPVCGDCFEIHRIQMATNMRAPRFKIEKWQT